MGCRRDAWTPQPSRHGRNSQSQRRIVRSSFQRLISPARHAGPPLSDKGPKSLVRKFHFDITARLSSSGINRSSNFSQSFSYRSYQDCAPRSRGTALISSRETAYCSVISSRVIPSSRFSETSLTGVRELRNVHAPLTLPGMLSTPGHWDQSRFVAMCFPKPTLCERRR